MQAGILNVKLVVRKLQGSAAPFQFMLLAGFTQAVTHTNADYVETLSPAATLNQGEIDKIVCRLVQHSRAVDHKFITNPDVQKRLDRLFDLPNEARKDGSFSSMGIGSYMPA